MEGNIFTAICLSTGQGGGPYMEGGLPWWGFPCKVPNC